MTFGSLYTGIGGFDLGLTWAGFDVRWQVEIDDWCRQVLARHWPDVARYTDIKTLDYGRIEPVELICAGFPCQPFSNAGVRAGTKDNRYLWPETLQTIQAINPNWVILENVAGLKSMALERGPVKMESRSIVRTANGDTYKAIFSRSEKMLLTHIIQDLEKAGYESAIFIIPACATDAKHIRKRIWVVAHTTRQRFPEKGQQLGERSKARIAGPSAAQSKVLDNATCTGCPGPEFAGTHTTPIGQGARGPAVIERCTGMADTHGGFTPFPFQTICTRGLATSGCCTDLAHAGCIRCHGGRTTSKGKKYPTSLRAAVRGMNPKYLPTPTVQDANNNGGPSQQERKALPLNAVVNGPLNPHWVEWLMGFPIGWTNLPD